MSSQSERMSLVDTNMCVPRLSTLKPSWPEWTEPFGRSGWREVYDEYGDPVPRRMVAMPDSENVDRALPFREYRPRYRNPGQRGSATDSRRFPVVGKVNPRTHLIAAEVGRQLDFGAVAVKLHSVHGVFSPADLDVRPSVKCAPSAGCR